MARALSMLVIPCVAIAVLVGCSGGGESTPSDEVGGSTGELGEAEGDDLAIGGDTACISGRVWELDIPDLSSQIASELATSGFEIVEYAGAGAHTLLIDEAGTLSAIVDVLFSVTVITEEGAQIALLQIHDGAPSGDWGWVGNTNTMEFANWDSGGYVVENQMTVNGVSLDSTIPIPSDPMDGTPWTVECAGAKMTTTTAGSPYIHRWTTED